MIRHPSFIYLVDRVLQATNMVLTPEGEVVVGHHLLKSNPAMVAEPAPENLEEFLMELFWFFGIKVSCCPAGPKICTLTIDQFTYGPKEPDLSDWKCQSVICKEGLTWFQLKPLFRDLGSNRQQELQSCTDA